MADGASLGLGVVSAVLQTYHAVTSAYDVYLSMKEFPTTYRELRTAFIVERYRLESWGDNMLSEIRQQRVKRGEDNVAMWKLFQAIFDTMWSAFEESSRTLEALGHIAGVPQSGDMSGQPSDQPLSMDSLICDQISTSSRACSYQSSRLPNAL